MARRTGSAVLPEVLHLLSGPVPAVQGPGPPTLAPDLLRALGALVPSDLVVYDDLAPRRRRVGVVADPLGLDVRAEPLPDAFTEAFSDAFWSTPGASHPDAGGDLVSVRLLGDVVPLRQWRSSPMHALLRDDTDIERQLLLPLGGTEGRSRRVRFVRLHGGDFTDTDRALATVLRPFLVAHLQAVELALHGARPPTVRQRQVLALLVAGCSNTEIARRLGISPQTARTHLQQLYARLGVSSRAQAVAVAGEVVTLPPS
ncbi:helix-turn-helix transcriptional regulator [Cellulomonas endophytica]|uniref:helix-turn-helix transcriptional regulator n=1 Tax=Cellulomonas endophytica TaxID=2494735 RepID=UPI00196B74F6|nr:LuxR family transcriptional regulator [Cellulomonas endophytica]